MTKKSGIRKAIEKKVYGKCSTCGRTNTPMHTCRMKATPMNMARLQNRINRRGGK